MMRLGNEAILGAAAFAALVSGSAAWGNVKAGVDAWARGDYAAAACGKRCAFAIDTSA